MISGLLAIVTAFGTAPLSAQLVFCFLSGVAVELGSRSYRALRRRIRS